MTPGWPASSCQTEFARFCRPHRSGCNQRGSVASQPSLFALQIRSTPILQLPMLFFRHLKRKHQGKKTALCMRLACHGPEIFGYSLHPSSYTTSLRYGDSLVAAHLAICVPETKRKNRPPGPTFRLGAPNCEVSLSSFHCHDRDILFVNDTTYMV